MHFENIHTFTYQKTLLHTLLLLVFKIVENLQYILNEPTCCKNSEKPTCIDLILTNQPALFQHNTVLETGL